MDPSARSSSLEPVYSKPAPASVSADYVLEGEEPEVTQPVAAVQDLAGDRRVPNEQSLEGEQAPAAVGSSVLNSGPEQSAAEMAPPKVSATDVVRQQRKRKRSSVRKVIPPAAVTVAVGPSVAEVPNTEVPNSPPIATGVPIASNDQSSPPFSEQPIGSSSQAHSPGNLRPTSPQGQPSAAVGRSDEREGAAETFNKGKGVAEDSFPPEVDDCCFLPWAPETQQANFANLQNWMSVAAKLLGIVKRRAHRTDFMFRADAERVVRLRVEGELDQAKKDLREIEAKLASEKKKAEEGIAAVRKEAEEAITKIKQEAEQQLTEARNQLAEKLRKRESQALKHKVAAERGEHDLEHLGASIFCNAVEQLQFLNRPLQLRVVGASPSFGIEDGRLVDDNNVEVDLRVDNLPDPTVPLDAPDFDPESVYLSDVEEGDAVSQPTKYKNN